MLVERPSPRPSYCLTDSHYTVLCCGETCVESSFRLPAWEPAPLMCDAPLVSIAILGAVKSSE